MNRKLIMGLAFAVGLAMGLGMAMVLVYREAEDPDQQTVREVVPDDAADELVRLRAQVANQRERIGQLEAELAAAETVGAPVVSAEETTGEAQDPREDFRRRMQERMDQRTDRRVEEMATKYGLTDLQKLALKDIYRKQMDYFNARRRGEDVEAFNLDAALQEVMTDEQFAKYVEESQQEIYNRAELMATGQVVRMSQLMPMSPEVEGMVYEAINLTAQEMMISRQEGESFDMRGVLEERLGTILTEEQMEVYRESMRGGGAGGGPGMGSGRGGVGP